MPATIITSRAALCEYVNHGAQVKYLFFWGHQPAKNGSISKTCFSQWFEAAFEVDHVRYPTAEHFMMAEKARLFADKAILANILKAPNPGAAKALGRKIAEFDEQKWLKHRMEIVVAANMAKFSKNAMLREFLVNTGDQVLVEASPVDKIWGIGLAADNPDAGNPNLWKGLNLLGFALMQVRQRLLAGEGV